MLRYYRTANGESEREEITYEKALDILLGSYRDNDMTRDMLTIPNRIQCVFSTVEVEDNIDAESWNMLPRDVEYDEDGNHIKENEYSIAFVDGLDNRYKVRIVKAETAELAIEKLTDAYDGDFEHRWLCIKENGKIIWER